MIFIIIGAAAIVFAVIMHFSERKTRNKLLEIQYQQTSSIKDALDTLNTVISEVGPDGVRKLFELKGIAKSNNPMKSEISGTECAICNYTIEERYEQVVERTDSNGRLVRDVRTGYDQVAGNLLISDFILDDGTGQVYIDPSGADFRLDKIVDRFEPSGSSQGGMMKIGGVEVSISPMSGSRRVLGYRVREFIFPLNRQSYILGDMVMRGETPYIEKPTDKEKPYIITTQTEEQLIKEQKSSAATQKILKFLSLAAGAASIAYGIYYIIREGSI